MSFILWWIGLGFISASIRMGLVYYFLWEVSQLEKTGQTEKFYTIDPKNKDELLTQCWNTVPLYILAGGLGLIFYLIWIVFVLIWWARKS